MGACVGAGCGVRAGLELAELREVVEDAEAGSIVFLRLSLSACGGRPAAVRSLALKA